MNYLFLNKFVNYLDMMKFILIFTFIFINLCFSALAESYHCHYQCRYEKNSECSLYYHRKSQNTFYEEKKWRTYNAQENDEHLLLIRNRFPEKGDLPEVLFVDIVHIDKLDNFKFMKNCVGNVCDKPILGKCIFVAN